MANPRLLVRVNLCVEIVELHKVPLNTPIGPLFVPVALLVVSYHIV